MNATIRCLLLASALGLSSAALSRTALGQDAPAADPAARTRDVLGCCAGTGIRVPGRYRTDTLRILQLDSARSAPGSRASRRAAILLLDRTDAAWWGWRGDSIAVWITVSFPQRYFVLAPDSSGLVGRGTDAADQVFSRPDGTVYAPESRWRMRLRRVDCPFERDPPIPPKNRR